jgi:ABC-type molybdate transport system substrate-binding protein
MRMAARPDVPPANRQAARRQPERPESISVAVYAAGSLKAAFQEIAAELSRDGGPRLHITFGAAGRLKQRILGGEECDLFASANLEHPRAVAASGQSVVRFARNRLCALVRSDLGVTRENLLDRMLDPAIRLGTSTPGEDPSGDYAQALFVKAARMRTGAGRALAAKAIALTGGAEARDRDGLQSTYSAIMVKGAADIFLTYVSNTRTVLREVAGVSVVMPPAALQVVAEYGLVVLTPNPAAVETANRIVSPAGQAILLRHGFEPAEENA